MIMRALAREGWGDAGTNHFERLIGIVIEFWVGYLDEEMGEEKLGRTGGFNICDLTNL